LRAAGWSVLRIWECSLRKRPEATIRRVIRTLGARTARPPLRR
jgi:G:T-mismatch repair DNA endonuclease (very short patch repair protein)